MSGSDPISNKDRYNRYAEDWRFQHKLIWEIPGVSIAIIAGIITVAFSFLGLWPRLALLSLGTFLIFGLAVAVFKHRFTADVRTSFLDDLDNDARLYPVQSGEALEHMKNKPKQEKKEATSDEGSNELNDKQKELNEKKQENKYHGLWPELMIKWPSEKLLIVFMFFAVAVLLSLVIYTSLEICCGLGPLEEPGKIITLRVT